LHELVIIETGRIDARFKHEEKKNQFINHLQFSGYARTSSLTLIF